MESFWNSIDIISIISKIFQWIAAISAIIALIFSIRQQTLKETIDQKNKEEQKVLQDSLKQKIVETQFDREASDDVLAQSISGTPSRKLNDYQKRRINLFIKPKEVGDIAIDFAIKDPTSFLLAKELKTELEKAGCKILSFNKREVRKNTIGLNIIIFDNNESIDRAKVFQLALRNCEIDAVITRDTKQDSSFLTLLVAYHPNTFDGIKIIEVK